MRYKIKNEGLKVYEWGVLNQVIRHKNGSQVVQKYICKKIPDRIGVLLSFYTLMQGATGVTQ